MGGSTRFEREIREQPRVLARQLEEARSQVEAVAVQIRRAEPKFVVLAARGSSDNAARYGQYLFGLELGGCPGLTAALATPSLFTLYGSRPSLRDALVIGVSQSGQSPDVVAVLEEARAQAAVTVAISNDTTSPLACAAEHVIALQAGVEEAVAASKTYTSSLFALAMLRAALTDDTRLWDELAGVPEHVAQALSLTADLSTYAAPFRDARGYVVLGRGLSYATAFELALKLGETSQVLALPYSSADFRHGPIAMAGADLPAIVIAPGDRACDDMTQLTTELKQRGSKTIAISDRDDLLARVDVPLRLPAGVPEWLSPIVSVVPGQLWALSLALQAGLDPDRPRGLAKVTRTR